MRPTPPQRDPFSPRQSRLQSSPRARRAQTRFPQWHSAPYSSPAYRNPLQRGHGLQSTVHSKVKNKSFTHLPKALIYPQVVWVSFFLINIVKNVGNRTADGPLSLPLYFCPYYGSQRESSTVQLPTFFKMGEHFGCLGELLREFT